MVGKQFLIAYLLKGEDGFQLVDNINTSGLMIFTNNGELANYLMHPSSNIEREYAVRVNGEVSDESLQILKEGVLLDDEIVRFSDIQKGNSSEKSVVLRGVDGGWE